MIPADKATDNAVHGVFRDHNQNYQTAMARGTKFGMFGMFFSIGKIMHLTL